MAPFRPSTPLRRSTAAVLCAGALLTAAACGGGAAEGGADAAISVQHSLGTVRLDAPPKRVVSLSVIDTDLALSVGVTPVAVEAFWGASSGIAPWQEDALADSDVTVIKPDGDGAIPIEQVANARPDLILAGGLHTVADQYDRLAEIAPTLGPVTAANADTWQQSAKSAGAALGRSDEAAEVVADLEERINGTAAEHPEFKGKEYSFSQAGRPGVLDTMRTEDDVTAHFFADLGLRMSDTALGLEGEEFVADVSYEAVEAIDADLVLVHYSVPKLRKGLEDGPVFKRLTAVEDGGYVALSNDDFAPVRSSTVLSIPEALDLLVPRLEKALG
ncbi:iron complex transport system substrate-binding protein [Murinocardiopsis flavida]|uniref:Iron complex transport system substrate-binding protein n=1 Tax=Murinocardiopsis flavida TaxID=645275 RepID=A0A2P8DKR1_9ACTN|nr:ABC transporter substrate-binding protein [Murinocardiopsis flavida]PSK97810.1 iron complex transport system substrate-binding protein [Murinocardiopsis flavida]